MPSPPTTLEQQLQDLLSQARQAQEAGRAVDIDELCRGCPELRPELQSRLQAVARFEGALRNLNETQTEPGNGALGVTKPLASAAAPIARGLPQVPGFVVEGELGRGGMGVVYLARQLALGGRPVALKMILHADLAGAEAQRRFQEEARTLAALRHPHIVQIFEAGQHEGKPYFVLELMGCGPLHQKLRERALTPKAAAALVEKLARAMHHVHTAKPKGIIHRDLKPHNVLLSDEGEPKITDFGLARRLDEANTAPDAVLGTLAYMAAEQAAGKNHELGPACDIYGLGAILYECLSGRPPFRAADYGELLRQVLHEEPPAIRKLQPDTPRDLETICQKAMAKSPARRFASAAELAEDLRRFLNDEPIVARRSGPLERSWRWCRRRPALAALWAAALLLLAAAAIAGWLAADRQAERVAADRELQFRAHLDLVDVDRSLREDRLTEAERALAHAGQIVGRMREPALADRFVQLRKDLALARELERIRDLAWLFQGDHRRLPAAAAEFDKAFAGYFGSSAWTLAPGLAAQVARSPASGQIATGLCEWWIAEREPARRRRLLELLREAAPETAKALEEAAGGRHLRDDLPLPVVVALGGAAAIDRQRRLDLMQSAWKRHPGSFALLAALAELLRQGDGSERLRSAQFSRAAVAARPDHPFPWNMLGHSLFLLGDKDSISAFERALEMSPDYLNPAANLGSAYLWWDQPADAVRALEQAIRIEPKHAYSRTLLAEALMRLSRNPEALAQVRRAAVEEPSYPKAWQTWGDLEQAAGRHAEAIERYRRAAQLEPKNIILLTDMALSQEELGELDAAIAALESAVKVEPNYARAWANLGCLRCVQGDFAGGLADFRQAQRAAPKGSTQRVRADRLIREAEAYLATAGRLDFLLRPEGLSGLAPDEAYRAAIVCSAARSRYADAVRFFRLAFARESWTEAAAVGRKEEAAKAALRAAAGAGTAPPPPAERPALRAEALKWLRAELALGRIGAGIVGAAGASAEDRGFVTAASLGSRACRWLRDPLFAPVRDPAGLAELPEDERRRWSAFWNEVRAVGGSAAPPSLK